jgi:hypothetical protein
MGCFTGLTYYSGAAQYSINAAPSNPSYTIAPQYAAQLTGAAAQAGAKPMSYDYGGSSWYNNVYGQSMVYAPQSLYSPPPIDYSQLAQTPTLPDYGTPQVYQSPNVEQTTSTAYKYTPTPIYAPNVIPSQYVYAPNIVPNLDYSGLQNTPELPTYGTNPPSAPTRSTAGGGSGGSSGGTGGQPRQQQQQQQQRPIRIAINNISTRSGSGQGGGNTGPRYGFGTRPVYGRGNYGGTIGYGGAQSGQYSGGYGATSADFNSPSIVPYLIVGGLGLFAFDMLKKKEH